MSHERWPVIDTHFHIGVNALIHVEFEDLLAWIDDNDVDVQMVMQVNEGYVHRTPQWNPYIGNDFIAQLQNRLPERIIGLGRVNPYHQPPPSHRRTSGRLGALQTNPVLEELDRLIGELGLWGLKMHPLESHYQINNPILINPIMERLTKLQEDVGRNLVIFIHAAGDTLNNSPEAVADIARQFPDLLFIASHTGYKWAMPTVAHTMAALPNVMLDLTTMAGPGLIREIYERYGPEKFCTGSDGPFATVNVKDAITRSITQNAEEFALINGGNLAKHFGLPKVKETAG